MSSVQFALEVTAGPPIQASPILRANESHAHGDCRNGAKHAPPDAMAIRRVLNLNNNTVLDRIDRHARISYTKHPLNFCTALRCVFCLLLRYET